MAWVDDHGVKRGGRGDGRGPEDGIDDFKQIGDRDVVASVDCNDGIAEDEFDVIHQNFLGTGGEANGDVLVLHLDPRTRAGEGRELVEAFDLREVDVFDTIALHFLPGIIGCLASGGEEDRERRYPPKKFFEKNVHGAGRRCVPILCEKRLMPRGKVASISGFLVIPLAFAASP